MARKLYNHMIEGVVPQKVISLLKEEDCFLAGGCLRSIINNEPISDYDLFYKSEEQAKEAAWKFMHNNEGTIKMNRNAISIWFPEKTKVEKLQFISGHVFDSPQDILDGFDFTVCGAVFNYDQNIPHITVHPEFYKDTLFKNLVYVGAGTRSCPVASLYRTYKYRDRGYKITQSEMLSIVEEINRRALEVGDIFELGRMYWD